jgi:hypothetical protein
MSRFQELYQQIVEDIAAPQAPIAQAAPQANTPKPTLQGTNDPKVKQAAQALGVHPEDLFKALTGPDTTHTYPGQISAPAPSATA